MTYVPPGHNWDVAVVDEVDPTRKLKVNADGSINTTGVGAGGKNAVTIADGDNVAQGTTTDAAYTSGAGTIVGLLKGLFARLRGGQATMANSLPVTMASDQGVFPVNDTPLAEVAATSPPASTNAGSDTSYTFSSQAKLFVLFNNTGADIWANNDATAAVGTRWKCADQQMLALKIPVTVLHIYTAAAKTINSGSAGLSVGGFA